MAKVVLAWPANPPEENVTGYSVFQDGTKIGTVAEPTIEIPNITPGVYAFNVAPINGWGDGPLSDPAMTPPAASKIPSISLTITIG